MAFIHIPGIYTVQLVYQQNLAAMLTIFCRASIVGAVRTISSAYAKMETYVTDV